MIVNTKRRRRRIQITEVKVTGEISAGEQFSGIFTGIVNNDTLLTVEMDEDFFMYVASNIDTAIEIVR